MVLMYPYMNQMSGISADNNTTLVGYMALQKELPHKLDLEVCACIYLSIYLYITKVNHLPFSVTP